MGTQSRPQRDGRIIHDYGPFTHIIEYPDGSAEFMKGLTTHFRVRIADVYAFSQTRGTKWLETDLNLLGTQGGLIAYVRDCQPYLAKWIENWFRSHPAFGGKAQAVVSVADELRKLAELRDSGVLTDAEFEAEKSKLLSR